MKTHYPVILEQLAPMLPPGGRHGQIRLDEDLHMDEAAKGELAQTIERNWNCPLPSSAAAEWRDLNDVCKTLSNALALYPA